MNKGLNYSEKLEAYIRNELTEKERLELEEQLRQDPLLQNELTLQKDIIASISDYRKNELKQRLNKIDVGSKSSPGDFTVGGAILGGIAIVGVAGFLIFKDSGKDLSSTQLSGAVSQMPVDSQHATNPSELTSENTIALADTYDTADSNMPETVTSPVNVNPAPKKTTPAKNTQTTIAPVVVEATQAIVEEEEIQKDDKLVLPESGVTKPAASAEPTLIIVDNNTSKYKLQYKYTNGQLFLYGFEKPYKIIDLPDQTQRFLLYNGKFYKLNRNQPQISPIQLVDDQQEIKALESYKSNNP